MTQELLRSVELTIDLPNQPDLPIDVRQAFSISGAAEVEQLSGGLVNETLIVRDGNDRSVFRRLSNVLSPALLEDTAVVGQHLAANGWEAPACRPTVEGKFYMRDSAGSLWHQMDYIDSDGTVPTINAEIAATAGALIGKWHATTRQLDYTPRFRLPHFHDTAYQAVKTESLAPTLPDQQSRDLARELVASYRSLPTTPDQPKQIIHADPKLDNMLFRDKRPFTLIDFDTVMIDQVWTDAGDFLRSLSSKLLDTSEVETAIAGFVDNYREAADLNLSRDQATYLALHATQRIALELGMRYLCDIVDGEEYFSWDPRYDSRRDNHFERAELQQKVANFALSVTNI